MAKFQVALAVAMVVGTLIYLAMSSLPLQSARVPARALPQGTASLEEVLERLDQAIEKNAPAVAAALQPGLDDPAIAEIEREHGFVLPPDVKALYRWHDGLDRHADVDFFDGLEFPPLSWLAENRSAYEQQKADANAAQKAVMWALLSDQEGWIELFPDGSGNGIFIDPERIPQAGPVILHDHEEGTIMLFRSLADLLTAFAEGYEKGLVQDPSEPFDIDLYQQIQELYEERGGRPAGPGS